MATGSAKTTFSANRTLDYNLANGTTYYVALHSADPGAEGANSELAGNNYARVACSNWPNAASKSKSNGAAVAFAAPSANWTTPTYWSLWTAVSGGSCIYHDVITTPIACPQGSNPAFAIGAIVIQEA